MNQVLKSTSKCFQSVVLKNWWTLQSNGRSTASYGPSKAVVCYYQDQICSRQVLSVLEALCRIGKFPLFRTEVAKVVPGYTGKRSVGPDQKNENSTAKLLLFSLKTEKDSVKRSMSFDC